MFEKFGEFDSAEELNLAAGGLLAEGDYENLYVLAEENGIEREFARMYIEGEIPVLADDMTAALGKLSREQPEAEKQFGSLAVCVAEYLKSLCDREAFAQMVRKKGRSLLGCLNQMRREAERQVKTRSGAQCVCIPPSDGYKMIRDYYEKGEERK